MFKLTAMYPNGPDVHFDFAYYTGTHARLARKRLGPELQISGVVAGG